MDYLSIILQLYGALSVVCRFHALKNVILNVIDDKIPAHETGLGRWKISQICWNRAFGEIKVI